MGFWATIGSSAASGAGSGAASSIFGGIDELIGLNDLKRSGELGYQQDLMASQFAHSKDAAQLEYNFAMQALKDSPAYARAGLEAAGYNPILAVNSAAGSLGGHFNVDSPRGGGNSGGTSSKPVATNATANATNDLLEAESDRSKTLAQIARLDLSASRLESAARSSEAEQRQIVADAFVEAVTGTANMEHHGPNAQGYVDLVERFKNKAERDRYLDSVEHQVYEDIRGGVSSASEAVRAGASLKSALRELPANTSTESHKFYHYEPQHVYHHSEKKK